MNNKHTHNRLDNEEVYYGSKEHIASIKKQQEIDSNKTWGDIAWDVATYKAVDLLKEVTLTEVLMVGIAIAVFDTDS
tara:strand:- start:45 stop:275 length:231 start_codon:yes stop_codon:yes gene_type:complete